jgi:hypothetical protein
VKVLSKWKEEKMLSGDGKKGVFRTGVISIGGIAFTLKLMSGEKITQLVRIEKGEACR